MCTLAMDALENAAQTRDLSEPALNRLFDAHRLMIELRAAQKLNTGLLEADGSVLLALTIWQRVEVSSRPLLPPVSLAERLGAAVSPRYDQIHRHIEGLRVECFQLLERKPNVDGERARPQCRQRAIEIAAAIAEPIGGAIEAD